MMKNLFNMAKRELRMLVHSKAGLWNAVKKKRSIGD